VKLVVKNKNVLLRTKLIRYVKKTKEVFIPAHLSRSRKIDRQSACRHGWPSKIRHQQGILSLNETTEHIN
jgi:hypothetical protein